LNSQPRDYDAIFRITKNPSERLSYNLILLEVAAKADGIFQVRQSTLA